MEPIRDCNGNPINYTDPTGHYSEAIYTLWKYVRGGIQLSKKTVKGYLIIAGLEQTVKLVQNLSRANTKKLLEKGYAMPQPAPAPASRTVPKSNSKTNVVLLPIPYSYGVGFNIVQASKISNKILTKNGKVDLSLFNNRNGRKLPKGGRSILGPMGYEIIKDIDKHGPKIWKLINKAGERIASLAADGKIVGK